MLDESEQRQNIFVTIDEGFVWIYRPVGQIREVIDEKHPAEFLGSQVVGIPKAIPIVILERQHVRDVPLVLSSMKSNKWLSMVTFREIDRKRQGTYVGNIAAIQSIHPEARETEFSVDPLSCLSSLEFETLIAKLLEERDCFVPAYKGGFLRDIDLLCKPKFEIDFDGISLQAKVTLSFQLKMRFDRSLLDQLRRQVDYAISLDSEQELDRLFEHHEFRNRVLGREWVRNAVVKSPKTLDWLEESLAWLPQNNRISSFR